MKLPSSILAFKLLQKAKISEEEKMLVMTGMNYADKGTLYEQPKTSLKTFKVKWWVVIKMSILL